MTILETKVKELNEYILRGDTVKAIELFYADHMTMQENEQEPRTGKNICINHEKKNVENVKEFRCTLLNQAVDNNKEVVFSEWEVEVVSKADKRMKLTEVSVQHWEQGKIVREKFYYKDFSPAT